MPIIVAVNAVNEMPVAKEFINGKATRTST